MYKYGEHWIFPPIASGETEYTRYGMCRILEADAVDVLMPDLQRIGGLPRCACFNAHVHRAEYQYCGIRAELRFCRTHAVVLSAIQRADGNNRRISMCAGAPWHWIYV